MIEQIDGEYKRFSQKELTFYPIQARFHRVISGRVTRSAGLILLVLFFFPVISPAEETMRLEPSGRGDNLTIKLVTVGPADEIYSWWGHTAFIVEDEETGWSRLYDYGQFTFDAENFVRNFVFGRLWFSVGRAPSRLALNFWESERRDIRIQRLNLAPQKELELSMKLEEDLLPENRTYLYHHYRDNCATRVRDIIDDAVDGQFEEAFAERSAYTLREFTRRYTYFHPLMDRILMFILGREVDLPISEYDEMFLPLRLEEHVSDFTYANEKGETVPLVGETTVYSTAPHRKPVLTHPPGPIGYLIVLGILLGGLGFFLLRFRRKRKKSLTAGYAVFSGLMNLSFGLLGSVLFFMAFFTDHAIAYSNENLLFINPLLLLVFPFCLRPSSKRGIGILVQGFVYSLLTAAVLIQIVLKITPWFFQDNWGFIALLLPVYGVFGPVNLLYNFSK